jgi:hypothetical protein
MVFDLKEVMPTPVADRLGQVTLAEERVPGDDPPPQHQPLQQGKGGFVLVGRSRDGVLLQDAARGAIEQGEQMDHPPQVVVAPFSTTAPGQLTPADRTFLEPPCTQGGAA